MTAKRLTRLKRVRKAHNVKANNRPFVKAYKRRIFARKERLLARTKQVEADKLHRQQGR